MRHDDDPRGCNCSEIIAYAKAARREQITADLARLEAMTPDELTRELEESQ